MSLEEIGDGLEVPVADVDGEESSGVDDDEPGQLPADGPGAGVLFLRRYTGKDFTTGRYAGAHGHSDDEEEGDSGVEDEETGATDAAGVTGPEARPTGGTTGKQKKKKKAIDWKTTMYLAYACFGAVFGDIGTSPLYVLQSTFHQLGRNPNEVEILGLMSLIFWSFTLIVIVEYGLIVLYADNKGEGGTIAIYSLLCRYGEKWFNTGISDQQRDITVSSRDDLDAKRSREQWSARYTNFFQTATMVAVIVGVALLLGDGVLTPAISVLSAVEGIAVAAPSMKVAVVPITIVILFLLFSVQFLGTSKIGAFLSPVIIVWLLVLAGMGAYNVAFYGPSVFRALSPQYAFQFFLADGTLAWKMMGASMLAITGTEALFADLGHFSRLSIQISTIAVAYPCLILQYLGQTAMLLDDPSEWEQAFWAAVPGPLYWFIVVLSILATIIASQALISASFSVVSQAMRLSLFPPVKIVHTSAHHATQIYSPDINWILMVLTIVVVAAFQSSEALAAAYGIAVCMDMMLTTILITTVMAMVWRVHWAIYVPFFLFYALVVGAYLSSNLLKVPSGGWLPLAMAFIIASIMGLWRWGKGRTMRQRWRFRKPYNKMFSLLTSEDALTSTKSGTFAVADLETLSDLGFDERDDEDYDSDDDSVYGNGSILVTAAAPAETMMDSKSMDAKPIADSKPSEETPIQPLAVKFGEAPVRLAASAPANLDAAAVIPSVEIDSTNIDDDGNADEEPIEAGAASANASFTSAVADAPPATSFRSILAPTTGFPRTITGDSRSIKILEGNTKGPSFGEVGPTTPAMSVHVTSKGLLDADIPIPRFPGLGIFFTEVTSGIPGVFAHWTNNIGAIPEVVVFVSIGYANIPKIDESDRLFITKNLLSSFWSARVTLGYMDEGVDRYSSYRTLVAFSG
ncbi:potassium transporter-domain-containing protein [Hyaloraphidium curvatum]|nr:potassium transporter-domain-containing protein [Hyaloraphidium curvatum]